MSDEVTAILKRHGDRTRHDRCRFCGMPSPCETFRIAEQLAAANAARSVAEQERDTLMRLLESLTPGGSEFYASPRRCAAWVNDQQSSSTRVAVEAVIARQAVEQERDDLSSVLDAVTADFNAAADRADAVSAQLAARDQQLAALAALDAMIATCATVYPDEGEPFVETDPSKFDCASFCENFGHHTLLEIRALLAPSEPYLPPLASYPVEIEVTEVREGRLHLSESDLSSEQEPSAPDWSDTLPDSAQRERRRTDQQQQPGDAAPQGVE